MVPIWVIVYLWNSEQQYLQPLTWTLTAVVEEHSLCIPDPNGQPALPTLGEGPPHSTHELQALKQL